ncbi:hypothetical protein B0H13DRAFT_2302149 [Mycena leptocephala]|nr:hypothetical protein B0H13DRAFT_2302149 [Mycena leptocephala]
MSTFTIQLLALIVGAGDAAVPPLAQFEGTEMTYCYISAVRDEDIEMEDCMFAPQDEDTEMEDCVPAPLQGPLAGPKRTRRRPRPAPYNIGARPPIYARSRKSRDQI